MFKDHPEIVTPGRYVFAPPNTPHYPLPHWYGSRNWVTSENPVDDDFPYWPDLGEVRETKHSYSFGTRPTNFPPPRLLGSAACVGEGEAWPLPILDRDFATGFDSRCFPEQLPVPPVLPTEVDILDCEFQQFLIEVGNRLYNSDGTAAAAYFAARFPQAVLTVDPDTDPVIPGSIIGVMGHQTIMVVSSTRTPQQWALQAFFGVRGPASAGAFSTHPLWFRAASRMFDRLEEAGGDLEGMITLQGHSYGAAVVSVMAARILQWNPFRNVQFMTTGCPAPGDARLVEILRAARQVNFCNTDDPVTYIPPSAAELVPFAAFVPAEAYSRWTEWKRHTQRTGLTLNGSRVPNPPNDGVYSAIFRLLTQALMGREPELFTAHFTSEYARRIRCPGVPVPSPSPAIQPVLWLQPESLDKGATGDSVFVWPDDSLYQYYVSANPGEEPTLAIDGVLAVKCYVEFKDGQGLRISPPLPLDNTHTIYAVGFLPSTPDVPMCPVLSGDGVSEFAPVHMSAELWYADGLNFETQATSLLTGTWSLLTVRRQANSLRFGVNGVEFASQVVSSGGLLTLDGVCLGLTGVPDPYRYLLAEVLVYDVRHDDSEFAERSAYFAAKYPLGL